MRWAHYWPVCSEEFWRPLCQCLCVWRTYVAEKVFLEDVSARCEKLRLLAGEDSRSHRRLVPAGAADISRHVSGLTVVQWVVNCKCSGLQVVECALEGLGGGVVESSSENRAESRVHVGGSGLTLSVANATKAEREADCYVAQHSIRYHHSPHPQPQ